MSRKESFYDWLNIGLVGLVLLVALNPLSSQAGPITTLTFTYNCTVSGVNIGTGTNNCSVGDTVAEVRISDQFADSDSVMDLFIEARWLDNDDTLVDGPSSDYNLNTIWLNVIETDNLLGPGGQLTWFDGPGPNDYNSMIFSFDSDPTTAGDNLIFKIKDDSVDDSNYKGFDAQLCGSDAANGGFGGNDSCGDINLVTNPVGQWVPVGYLFSGNGFDLYSGIFNAVTENSAAPSSPDTLFYSGFCNGVAGSLASMIQIDPATSGTNDAVCTPSSNGNSGYGPRYGAYATVSTPLLPPTTVPAPGSLVLVLLGILGIAGRFRRSPVNPG